MSTLILTKNINFAVKRPAKNTWMKLNSKFHHLLDAAAFLDEGNMRRYKGSNIVLCHMSRHVWCRVKSWHINVMVWFKLQAYLHIYFSARILGLYLPCLSLFWPILSELMNYWPTSSHLAAGRRCCPTCLFSRDYEFCSISKIQFSRRV